jgi:hypothetical protein
MISKPDLARILQRKNWKPKVNGCEEPGSAPDQRFNEIK